MDEDEKVPVSGGARAWVVWGEEGEYSDRRVWVVRAFTDGGEARAFVDAVSAQAREVWMTWRVWEDDGAEQGRGKWMEDRERFPVSLDPVGNAPDASGYHHSYGYCDPPRYHLDEVPLGPVAS